MNLSKKYSKSKYHRWTLRFLTIDPDGNNVNGVVTDIKLRFIVLRELRGLDFDGVVILPKRVLKGYRDSKLEKCFNQIIRQNGNIKKAQSPRWLKRCNSLIDVIWQLRKRDIWPIVEILLDIEGKTESDFYLGQIMEIKRDAFWMRPYDASGNWEDEYWIELSEILKIEFYDQYSTSFNQYMRSL